MRPNIEEIRERLIRASRNEKWFVKDGSSIFVTWYSGRDVKIAEAVRPVWHENRFKGDEEAYYNAEFIAHSRTDIPALLTYIDELENMPLVHTIMELKEENERLKLVRGGDSTHCHHRYLLTEDCPYCKGSKELALRNVSLQEENERLNEALELIARGEHPSPGPVCEHTVRLWMEEVARQALEVSK